MRRFELVDGTSSKFWAVAVEGSELVVRYGRIGTDGTEKRKPFASGTDAQREAEKLVREKTGKGYREAGGAPAREAAVPAKPAQPAVSAKPAKSTQKTTPVAPPKSAATSAAESSPITLPLRVAPPPRAPLVVPTRGQPPRTQGFAFTPELDALWARGFPELFVLTEPVGNDKADKKLVQKALDDIDPVLPVFVSRRAAGRFLHAYAVGKTWTWSNAARGPVYDDEKVQQVAAALTSDQPVDLSVLERILANSLPHGPETYPWRVQQAVWLAEALLGTEPVVQLLVRELARVSADHALWGFRGDPGRTNNHANHLTAGLAVMGLRMERARFVELIEPLRDVTATPLEAHASIVRALFDDAHAPPAAMSVDFALGRRDPAPLAALAQDGHFPWWRIASVYVLGPEWLAEVDGRSLKRQAKWQQLRLVDELGTVAHEEVARVMAWLATGASARKGAVAWLLRHADLARPALVRMTQTKGEQEVGALALACLDTGEWPAGKVKKLGEKALNAALNELFAALPARMQACGGDEALERETMTQAFDTYCELRSAVGDPTPEAYFSHNLDCFRDVDAESATRWIDLGVAVMG